MSGSGLLSSQNAGSLSPPSHITSLHARAVSHHPSIRNIEGQIRFLEDGFSMMSLASTHNTGSHRLVLVPNSPAFR